MILKKKLLVSALALNLFALPATADLNLETGVIEYTGQLQDWLSIALPSPDMRVLQGAALEIDFIVPREAQARAIVINGMRAELPSTLTGGNRFQGKLYGATEKLGRNLVEFEFYNQFKGVYYHSTDIVVKDALEFDKVPKLDVSSPQEGQILQQGENLFVDFTLPDESLGMQNITVNGNPLFISWVGMPAGSNFSRQFSGYTQKAGPLKIAFNYYNKSDGQLYSLEKNISVSGEASTSMEVLSPLQHAQYGSGDLMPIEVIPSSANKNPHFFVFVDNKQVAKITEKPYRFDFSIPSGSELGQKNIRIDEFNGDNFVDEKWIQVEFVATNNKGNINLEIKQGTAAVAEGESKTVVAKINAGSAEINDKIKHVEFYLNDKLVETDSTAPFEFTHRYENTDAETGRYSTLYSLNARAIMKNLSFDIEPSANRFMDAMPAVGAEFCQTAVSAWNQNTHYKQGDAVRYKGFFFVANSAQSGIRPGEQHFVYGQEVWTQVNCSEHWIRQAESSIVSDEFYTAKVGETIEIKGAVKLPENRSLSKLIMKDKEGKQTLVAVDEKGKFSFPYIFEGNANCLSYRCDTLYFEAVDNLQYPQQGSIVIQEDNNIAPSIDELYSKVLNGIVHVDFIGRDDGQNVTATIYANGNETPLASKDIRVQQYGNYQFRGSLTFENPSNPPSFYVLEVKDERGQIIRKSFKPAS